MKKLTTILSSLTIAAIAVIYFSGCSSNTVAAGGVPTGVSIVSSTSTSVTVSWTRNSSDANADTIVVTNNGQQVGNSPVIVASGSSSGTVSNLPAGELDSIYIGSVYGPSAAIAFGSAVTIGIPTNAMLQSQNSSSIGAEWTRAAGDNGADTMIVMTSSGQQAGNSPQIIAAGTSSGTVTNLTTNTVYTVIIASAGGEAASMPWMTAVLTTSIQLYQFSSSGKSGLQLNGPDGSAIPISATKTNASSMDFFLDDFQNNDSILSASQISFEGAEFLNGDGAIWRNSFFDPNALYVPSGLSAYYTPTDFTSQIDTINNPALQANAFDIPNDDVYASKGSRILLCETMEGNFAKIEIVPDPNTGMLYSGSGTDKYITVNVSYQPMANAPYAARGHRKVISGTRPLRVLAH